MPSDPVAFELVFSFSRRRFRETKLGTEEDLAKEYKNARIYKEPI